MYSSKTLLILGASELQMPLIKKAKEMGFKTVVVDINPKSQGFQYADESHVISTIDTDNLLELSKKINPNGIITMATDLPMQSIGYINDQLRLNGIDLATAKRCTNKKYMMSTFRKNNLPHPYYFTVKNYRDFCDQSERFSCPIIIKPTIGSGSRGVIKVNDPCEIEKSIEYSLQLSKEEEVIVQEFFSGREVSVETFSIDRKVEILAVTDKITSGSPHFVEISHVQPSNLGENVLNQVKKIAENAVLSLGIDNGPAHVEIMVGNKDIKLIEVGARLGGDYISSHLLPISTGVDVIQLLILNAIGERQKITKTKEYYSCVRFIIGKPGKILSIKGVKDALDVPGVEDVIITKNEGDLIRDLQSSNDRVGAIITKALTYEKAVEISKIAETCINIDVLEEIS